MVRLGYVRIFPFSFSPTSFSASVRMCGNFFLKFYIRSNTWNRKKETRDFRLQIKDSAKQCLGNFWFFKKKILW